MNRITRIVIGIALALSSACNYLDVVPEDNATLDDAFKSQDKALSYLFSIYGHLPNNIQYWMPGQPCGGDDLAVAVKGRPDGSATRAWFTARRAHRPYTTTSCATPELRPAV